MFIIPTNRPIKKTCKKCGKEFTMTETRTCTSLNNFMPVCPKCQLKDKTKSIFSIFQKDKDCDND